MRKQLFLQCENNELVVLGTILAFFVLQNIKKTMKLILYQNNF